MLPRDGVLLVLLSCAWFSAAALTIKSLGPEVPVVWVVFLRNAVSVLPVLWLMRRGGFALRSENPRGLILRGVWGVAAMACGFWAIPRMPMANVTLLGHASPLYAAMLGTVFLGEPLERGALAFMALAFAGLYLAVPPLETAAALPTAMAVLSGVFAGLAFTALRAAASREEPLRVVLYYALVGTALFAPAAALSGWLPGGRQLLLLVGVGAFATVGQVLASWGFARAPVAKASLGTLVIVVLNILGAWALWGERPDARTWAGCALIILGVLGLTEGFRKRLLLALPD